MEWNKVDVQITRSSFILSFRNSLLNVCRLAIKPICTILNPISLKSHAILRVILGQVNENSSNIIPGIVQVLYVHVVWRFNPFSISFLSVIISQASKPF